MSKEENKLTKIKTEDILNQLTAQEFCWIGRALVSIHLDKMASGGSIGGARVSFLSWLLDNRNNIKGSYRNIAEVSNVSLAVVHSTVVRLLEVGLLEKNEGTVYTVLFKQGR